MDKKITIERVEDMCGGHWLFPKDKLTFTQANRYLKRIPETKGFSYKVVKI